jgi:hypothetical protein
MRLFISCFVVPYDSGATPMHSFQIVVCARPRLGSRLNYLFSFIVRLSRLLSVPSLIFLSTFLRFTTPIMFTPIFFLKKTSFSTLVTSRPTHTRNSSPLSPPPQLHPLVFDAKDYGEAGHSPFINNKHAIFSLSFT